MISSLLDTHALLWALAGDDRLPAGLADDIDHAPASFGVSDASLCEIAIKRSLGRLRVPEDLPRIVADLGFERVPITAAQAWAVSALPLLHRDPFDRLLVAQARDLDVPLATGDRAMSAYDVAVLWR